MDADDDLAPISRALNVIQNDPAPGSEASWASPSLSPPPPPSLSRLSVSDGSQAPVQTKAEPDDFGIKSELLDRLKQEVLGASSSADGQLRGLLMKTPTKTSAVDKASKTLLQLAGQTEDVKTPRSLSLVAASHPSAPDASPGLARMTATTPTGAGFAVQGKTELVPEGDRPKKIRHKKRVNGNKICLVCWDKALAHNFDVITCESCKAFFRRNALKSQSLQRCMFQNNCVIDKNTRRFCPSCRLKKCFDIGMKTELILDEDERRLRREKKAERMRQQAASSSTPSEDGGEFLVDSSSTSTLPTDIAFSHETSATASPSQSFPPSDLPQQASVSTLPSSLLPSFHTLRDQVSHSPSAANRTSPYGQCVGIPTGMMTPSQPSSAETSPFSSLLTHMSTSPFVLVPAALPTAQHSAPQPLHQPHTAFATGSDGTSAGVEILSQNQQQGSAEDIQQRQQEETLPFFSEPVPSLTAENAPCALPGPAARIFKHVPRDQLPSDPFMYWIVSSEERLMLANLTNAYQEVLLSLPERSLCRNMPLSDSYFIHDFLNEIDDAMYKIVQFSKHIADFRQMRKEDQIAMLKSSAMHTFGIACCAAYVHERDCWLSLQGDLTLSHLRKLTNDDPYIQVGVEYCRSVKSLVKNDFTIYALIHCMILFDPRDAKILDRQMINQTRDKYVIMLKHYLESQYSYLYADEYFVAIQERVREIIHLAKTGNAMFKRYSSAFQPLITEMLSST